MNKIFIGDCREVMSQLIEQGVKVQTCVTSPPYWGLRDYGVDGQLGFEKTIEEYVQNMVEVFSLVNKLLTDDGTLWLNLGDTYNGSGKGGDKKGNEGKQSTNKGSMTVKGIKTKVNFLKSKDLVGIPWRVAFALQQSGWYLRSDIIWHKPNPMPESIKDRPTKSHEYIFLLSKNAKYYYDYKAITEPAKQISIDRLYRAVSNQNKWLNGPDGQTKHTMNQARQNYKHLKGKAPETFNGADHLVASWKGNVNKRSVWTVPTSQTKEAHFATFPLNLIKPCILAGSRTGDTVLDPFFGSGTTGEVAESLGRKWLGIELNPKYEPFQRKRTAQMGIGL